MRIVVCLKQVPDTNDVRIDPKTGTLIREGVPSIINPDDRHALEEGLRLAEQHGGEVIALTMGPPQAEEALREAQAMGAHRAILVSDRKVAGSDTFATASVLAAAVRKIGDCDLILCGQQAIDGDTAQVGPQLAARLDLPQVTYTCRLEVAGGKAIAQRVTEYGIEEVETPLPALVTATRWLNRPRYLSVMGIVDLKDRRVEHWTLDQLELDENQVGLTGSPTRVKKTFAPDTRKAGEVVQWAGDETVALVMEKLRAKNIV